MTMHQLKWFLTLWLQRRRWWGSLMSSILMLCIPCFYVKWFLFSDFWTDGLIQSLFMLIWSGKWIFPTIWLESSKWIQMTHLLFSENFSNCIASISSSCFLRCHKFGHFLYTDLLIGWYYVYTRPWNILHLHSIKRF